MTEKAHQPRLVSEPEASYQLSPKEEARKAAYRERLREYLQDPEFRATPGFPIADDEAILALSDPPYYTACPNPFLSEIIAEWQAEREEEEGDYHREPFATDVSEGKGNPIYNTHSYHTKVPHPAIMRYILHYTEPGDIVFDGFAGTGMTGVAAQLCGDRTEVENLGYRIGEEGMIYDPSKGDEPISTLGIRKAVLNDLAPAATFIAHNYNAPVDASVFEHEAKRILREMEEECGWMYETLHTDSKTKGRINYIVWSDVFVCPQCGEEMPFWDVGIDHEQGKVLKNWPCSSCGVQLSKKPKKDEPSLRVERAFEMRFDRFLGKTVRQAQQVPMFINYSIGKKCFEKKPDAHDFALIEKIKTSDIPDPVPVAELPDGFNTQQPRISHGLSHVHHFYTQRNLWALATLHRVLAKSRLDIQQRLRFWASSYNMTHSTLMTRIIFKTGGKKPLLTGHQSGTLYTSSLPVEKNILWGLTGKIRNLKSSILPFKRKSAIVTTQSASSLEVLPSSAVDYVFVDPPFGANLMYSELNFLWEAWLSVFTNNKPEAIINKIRNYTGVIGIGLWICSEKTEPKASHILYSCLRIDEI